MSTRREIVEWPQPGAAKRAHGGGWWVADWTDGRGYFPLAGPFKTREECEASAHTFIPSTVTVPALYSGEDVPAHEKTAVVKLFTPWSGWTWYILEADGDLCFGLVDGLEVELGYFNLGELRDLRGPGGLRIERDVHFAPTKLGVVHPGLVPAEERT